MHESDDEARRLLGAATDDMPPGIDLLGAVRKRQAARGTRAKVAAGALSVAAATALVVGGMAAFGGSAAPAGPSARAAQAAVLTAVTKTSLQSYRVTITTTTQVSGGPHRQIRTSGSGEFDPVRRVGELNGGRLRIIDRHIYVDLGSTPMLRRLLGGKTWLRITDPFGTKPSKLDPLTFQAPQTLGQITAQDLLTLLKRATGVHRVGPASGPGWTGTEYAFAMTNPIGAGATKGTFSVRGTVGVDQQARVRDLRMTTTISFPGVGPGPVTTRSAVTFGDFGVPVSVTAPPPSQVITKFPAGNAKFPVAQLHAKP